MTKITQSLTIAFQFCGQRVPDEAVKEMVKDLSQYPEDAVLLALQRCRRELKSIKFSDIIDRIPGGHPGAEEAWALVARALGNEQVSIVWTEPMREAMGVAMALDEDPVAARMAFKETYTRLVGEARAEGLRPQWNVSFGADRAGRDLAKLEAENRNRSVDGLPALSTATLALPGPGSGVAMPDNVRSLVDRIGQSMHKQKTA